MDNYPEGPGTWKTSIRTVRFDSVPKGIITGTLLFAAAACANGDGAEQAQLQSHQQAVVYGEDDRQDVYAEDGPHGQVATESVVALIPPYLVEPVEGGGYRPHPQKAGDLLQLCEEEQFIDQPSVANCSGVLITEDLVLTAGHCFESGDRCDRYVYAFNYHYSRRGQPLDITDLDIHGCSNIVARELGTSEDGVWRDFALVRLDRPVDWRRRPVQLAEQAPRLGESVSVIGFPQGLPAKIDTGAIVRGTEAGFGYWYADTDTFGGSSGSPIFNSRLELAGILVQGREDYSWDEERQCQRTQRFEVGDNLDAYEKIADVRTALDTLCPGGNGDAQNCKLADATPVLPPVASAPGETINGYTPYATCSALPARSASTMPALLLALGLLALAAVRRQS